MDTLIIILLIILLFSIQFVLVISNANLTKVVIHLHYRNKLLEKQLDVIQNEVHILKWIHTNSLPSSY